MGEQHSWKADSPTRNLVALAAEGDLTYEDVAAEAGDLPLGPDRAARLAHLRRCREGRFHADLWFVLTHQQLPPADAQRLWMRAMEHKRMFEERLGRRVGIAVAALDLLHHETRELATPVLLDAGLLDRIVHAATLDGLTGLFNRGALDTAVARELARARRDGTDVSLLMIDVDNFKRFNDENGHVAGDGALREVADQCVRNVRGMDVVGRYGGEELCVLLPGASRQQAYETAERIRGRVAAACGVTISVGVADADAGRQSVADLYRAADRALYAAKHAGRNCTRLRVLPAVGATAQ